MALSDIKIKSLKAGIKPDGKTVSKPYKVADEKGLYLDIGLKGARERRDEHRKQVANGIDPLTLKILFYNRAFYLTLQYIGSCV